MSDVRKPGRNFGVRHNPWESQHGIYTPPRDTEAQEWRALAEVHHNDPRALHGTDRMFARLNAHRKITPRCDRLAVARSISATTLLLLFFACEAESDAVPSALPPEEPTPQDHTLSHEA